MTSGPLPAALDAHASASTRFPEPSLCRASSTPQREAMRRRDAGSAARTHGIPSTGPKRTAATVSPGRRSRRRMASMSLPSEAASTQVTGSPRLRRCFCTYEARTSADWALCAPSSSAFCCRGQPAMPPISIVWRRPGQVTSWSARIRCASERASFGRASSYARWAQARFWSWWGS
ncbi:hypothetical protein VTK73DRAFT_2793 [Phialemonium thermophilum]|uniref:Uncharacterized protein n=1 Tax=Phialemonium thermophilum TaxID=223376 RepID=A0ABR3VPR0_9PEZI